MYWATEAPKGITTGPWRGRRRLGDFEGFFEEGAEVLVSNGKPEGRWMYSLYKVVGGKLKKQKDRGAMNLTLGRKR